jgi:hypothetical protein
LSVIDLVNFDHALGCELSVHGFCFAATSALDGDIGLLFEPVTPDNQLGMAALAHSTLEASSADTAKAVIDFRGDMMINPLRSGQTLLISSTATGVNLYWKRREPVVASNARESTIGEPGA